MQSAVPEDYCYLDWAATAPLSPEAAAAMAPYFEPGTANIAVNMNANSLHRPGRAAFAALEEARRFIARDLGARRPNEIIFTSGATEADNAALFGLAHGAAAQHPHHREGESKGRIITSALEHDAVLAPLKRLAKEGFEVVTLKPDHRGFLSEESLRDALTDDTLLVSIQMANSEIGSIQPIAALGALAHEAGALFHSDATQALGKMPLSLQELPVDAASFSAHKIGGPKGIGALYLAAGTPFEAQMLGGGQEDQRRSSTQNVAGAVGFAAACTQAVRTQAQESARQRRLRDGLYRAIDAMEGIRATVSVEPDSTDYLPSIVHGLAEGLESETLILRLDNRGYGVSGGSACSSHSLEPSRVLTSMGISADDAYGALRVSFGSETSEEVMDHFVQALTESLKGA